ncbi:hypothetical protein PsYK624_014120 [Phanerochaete sordida]|uniref:Uncharacterized protein n=1 Tax=Phanerochaete sordida TaxID=48140 RepID=A0A9P3L8T5_9APHY|nr:hypothetical protein PsYK624_014120 [Phanerochaete sordida]
MVRTISPVSDPQPRSPPPMAPSALPVVRTTDKLDPLSTDLSEGPEGREDGHAAEHVAGKPKARVPRPVITEWVGGGTPCVIA